MATQGFSKYVRLEGVKFAGGFTAATLPSNWYLALWVGDPGDDGQSGAEVTGTGYTRNNSITSTAGWTTPATGSNDAVINLTNVGSVSFGPSGAAWSSSATITYVALWKATGTTNTNFLGRSLISGGGIVVGSAGITVTIAATAFAIGFINNV